MNEKYALVICLIVIVLMFVGCVEKETSVYTSTPTVTLTPEITEIPTPTSIYSIGDVISSSDDCDNMATLILDYDYETDEYLLTYIYKIGGIWLYQSEKEFEKWQDKTFTEIYKSFKITHVNLSDVMSWGEYWEGGGYEKYKSIQLRCDLENEGSVPKNYYETADKFVGDPKDKSIKSLYDILINLSKLPEYEEDEFMCGHASAYLEWYLEGAGFNTTIASGFNNPKINYDAYTYPQVLPLHGLSSVLHSWVIVYLPEGKVAIESTYLCEGDNYLPPAIVIDKWRKYEIYSFTYKEYDDYKRTYDSSIYIVPESFDEFVEEYYCWNLSSLSSEYYDFVEESADIYEDAYYYEGVDWWNKPPYHDTIKW